jgi:murein DD-endopeptidase MepM/ murein hydrolase activator NlpD
LRPHLRPSELTPDDELRFFLGHVDGQAMVETLSIRKDDQNRIPIIYRATRVDKIATESDFTVEVIEPQIEERLSSISLKVQGTLYQTFSKVPFGNELMQRLMGIFTWQMQMPRDVLPHDEIELLVIEKYVSGKLVGYGKIQSAFYRQPHQELFAIFFVSKDRSLQGFFDQNGKSLEREFSVSPVYETTATSNQKWRLHPIKKRRIRHNGTDYRGSIGTDFFSIADGVVIEKRFDRNVGNMIRVRHRYGVYSEYFHADRLESSLKISDRVKRGQKLGTIGRTGRLCTGPHLHLGIYRMEGNTKRFINVASMRKILKPAPDIDLDHLAEFNIHLKNQLAKMDAPKKTVVAEGSDTVIPQ